MTQFVAVHPAVCTGCRECEVVCSLYHFGECNPERSAIRVIRKEADGLVTSVPLVCQQCAESPCIEACPAGALSRENESGSVCVDTELCTGCGECREACRAGCIFMDPKRQVALCCDLCGGEPQCVTLCHSHCLTLEDDGSDRNKTRIDDLVAVLSRESLWEHLDREGGR